MEARLRALALEELALHAFPGISFEQLCTHLQDEHQVHLDPFVKRVLWRTLYHSTDAVFTRVSACGIDSKVINPTGADSTEAENCQPSQERRLPWRDPSIPPDLLLVTPTCCRSDELASEDEAASGVVGALEVAVDCSSELQRCWLLSTSAGIPLRLLTAMDFSSDREDFERRVAEIPFRVLRNVARHKEHGQWQYRIAQELELDPKSVFHHLKPLYRDELICHMQLAIPSGHKALESAFSAGSVSQLFGKEVRFPGGRAAAKANLTMSVLLWSSRFFCPLQLPAEVRGLMTAHHLLPLQQQAIELLRNAPNNILLEEEMRHFCTSKLLNSDQAPYLRLSNKQVCRLFHRLREVLERTGMVRRVRAFCKQTFRYERCLLYSHAEESHGGRKEDALQAGGPKDERDALGDMISQVKVEEGTLAATAARGDLRDSGAATASGAGQAAGDAGDEGEDGPSIVLELEGASLSSLTSLLLKAAGSEGVTTVELAHLLGLDNKRSGKILAEFHRRNLVTRVAERRGKCFLYRYISKELPHLKALLAEAPAALKDAETSGTAAEANGGISAYLCPPGKASSVPPTHARSPPGSSSAGARNVALENDETNLAIPTPPPEAPSAASATSGASCTKQKPAVGASHSQRQECRASALGGVDDGSGSARARKRAPAAMAGRGGLRKRSCPARNLPTQGDTNQDEQTFAETAISSAAQPEEALARPAAEASGFYRTGNEKNKGDIMQVAEVEVSQRKLKSTDEKKEQIAAHKLPPRTQRLLDTPQFAKRLALFKETIQTVGCSTIPSISKAIADMEQTANGPDRKTVQRMADVAMQLEPRIQRGRLAPSKGSADRLEETAGASVVAGEITFFYWTESHDQATAEQRIAAVITQRRAQGCREAIRRNQLLLDGKLKEAGEELQLSGATPASTTPQLPEQRNTDYTGESISDTARPVEERGTETSSGVVLAGSNKDALVDQQIRGLESEISRLANLESRSIAGSVMQPCPATTAASLLMVEKTLPLASLHDKVSFSQKHLSFYGFIFPVMVRAKCFHQYLLSLTLQLQGSGRSPSSNDEWHGVAVSTMIRRMPLESFLRLIGCGYALPMLDEHLAKESASRQPMYKLPGTLFRLLVFSSRQILCYRQLHPKAKMPVLGLGKKNAGTAVRKLLSLLVRMGIAFRVQAPAPNPSEVSTQRTSPPTPSWKLHEVLRLPTFSATDATDAVGAPEAREFDGLSHEGVESFWQQLQLQVSQWMIQEQQITWALDTGAEQSQFFSAHSNSSDAPTVSDKEIPEGAKVTCAPNVSTRKRPQPPKGFAVPEAFNSKNWKGQVAFTGSARTAMDAFAMETLEKLRDAGGAELEAVVLNPTSPQIVELSARVGYPTDAVLRYLIRVFEIKGGRGPNHALLVGGTSWEGNERAQGMDTNSHTTSMQPTQLVAGAIEASSLDNANQPVDSSTHQEWFVGPTKIETKERDRGVGLIVHRTREVRFQCHHCGHFYSWEKSIRLHYAKVHREAPPTDETLYVLPWERKRRQEDNQQQAELSKFKKRRRTIPSRAGALPSDADKALRATERFTTRLLTRGSVKSVEAPASGFLLRATLDEEAVLASMSREDEITLIGAAVVAERLWQSADSAQKQSNAGTKFTAKQENRSGPLSDVWLPAGTPQSLPPEDHLIWQILGRLCCPPLAPASARLYVGFILNRRALNARIYSSFRRLEPSALRHFVLEGRMPSALETRLHSVSREEGTWLRKAFVCRPLNSPRILMARNMLKAIVFTPLPFYRPAFLFTALRELRPLELNGLWRAWQRRGWVTTFKPSSGFPLQDKKDLVSTEPAARQPQQYRRPEIAAALESKCRRPFVLSSGSRLSLFGRLRDYRSLSALLESTLELTARTAVRMPSPILAAAAESPLGEKRLMDGGQPSDIPCDAIKARPATDTTPDFLLAHLVREDQHHEANAQDEAELANDADLQLLQLLESDHPDSTSVSKITTLAIPRDFSVSGEVKDFVRGIGTQAPLCNAEEAVAVVGQVRLPVNSQVSGCEVLAALEGLARGKLWLSPFWGTEGRLPDSPEAADDAELLNLLEEEDQLDSRAGGGSIWNDVPEWLTAISLGRGEDEGELLSGRALRKPTEGGIEAHITAHAAGVPEITAVTCAVLGGPTPLFVQRTGIDGLPAAQADTSTFSEPYSGANFRGAEVGGICKELRGAFDCSRAVPSAPLELVNREPPIVQNTTRLQRQCVIVAAASHLADGLFGAAGEFDAFDASLLPPILTDRTSSAAVCFSNNEEREQSAVSTGDARAPLLYPGLTSGFPLSLPTYAGDHKQHWRLAAKAAEAFAPPGCTCCAACGSTSECKRTAEGSDAYGSSAGEGDPPCSPVVPLPAFSRTKGSTEGVSDIRGTSEVIPELGPTEVLIRCLTAAHAAQTSPPSHSRTSGSIGLSEDPYQMPEGLLAAVEEMASIALRVQLHYLLPLLPTPPSPVAATCLHDAALEELNLAWSPAASVVSCDEPKASSSTKAAQDNGRNAAQDWTVCTALTLCTAWILAAVLSGEADGMSVPELLLDLSDEADTTTPERSQIPLGNAARLAFRYAVCKLANTGGRDDGLQNAARMSVISCTTRAMAAGHDRRAWAEDIPHNYSCSAAAFACQLFLVSVSVLCWLRLVVPVPAGGSWRLVSAAAAATRFCLKEQRILHDSVASRWASHGRDDELYQQEKQQFETAVLSSPHGSVGCGGKHGGKRCMFGRCTAKLPPRPAMIPRAIWATWGPVAFNRQCHQRADAQPSPYTPHAEAGASVHNETKTTRDIAFMQSAGKGGRDVDLQAVNVCEFLSALLTWEETILDGSSLSEEAFQPIEPSTAKRPSRRESVTASGSRLRPVRLSSDILPACAWMRLDGRLHASLVQLLCLRLWGLLMQRPGSTAQQLQGMLCLLDDCEVELLLHALAEEGIITAAVLWGPATRCQGSDVTDTQRRAQSLDTLPGFVSGELAVQHADPQGSCYAASVESSSLVCAPGQGDCISFHAALPKLSVADYALRVQTIYLPNAASDVLPKFQPLLLPKLATCDCGCSVRL